MYLKNIKFWIAKITYYFRLKIRTWQFNNSKDSIFHVKILISID